METGEIRRKFLSFFEERGHLPMPSASLVPPTYDPSVLLTTAGMQPFKPYFRGEEEPPSRRLTSCQKCFRTPDIEEVGTTARHLTFFEMLGNFSVGDYFKDQAVRYALELVTEGYGLKQEDLWISVFGGDEDLNVGPDDEAIEQWRAVGIPDERIVRLGRADNFWQAGPTGPCGPCSELYVDRGVEFGGPEDRPGDDTDRFLEIWNLVFMQFELHADGSLTDLPAKNIDTGMGLDRMAAILQDVPSVFDTENFRPLVTLGEELSGHVYGESFPVTRALRILADHARGAAFMMADGVVPSNEDRGYVLRRIMRRAIQQGKVLGIDDPFLPMVFDRVIQISGGDYPELVDQRDTIMRWAGSEEEHFGRTLEQGQRMLGELIERAREEETSWVSAEDAFRLHDTYGFPFEMTRELLGEAGLSVDDQGFEELMDRAREKARAGGGRAATATGGQHERVLAFTRAAVPSRFRGYEETELETVVSAVERVPPESRPGAGRPSAGRPDTGLVLVKLEESPFYAEGGGQVADRGRVETPSGAGTVTDVYRVGDDQALALEEVEGEIGPGEPARAAVDRALRVETMRNHTATHLLHAALRERLGTHVRQAGSYVGPDKLRFDFTHGERLGDDELADVERQIAAWIAAGHRVHAVETTRDEAERLGAMALFGEKYGDWVRMVEVDGVSRELCGGTHVKTTAEVGLFHVISETSSASNVRRIEAVSGSAATALFRERSESLRQIAELVRTPESEAVRGVERLAERVRELGKKPSTAPDQGVAEKLVAAAADAGGVPLVVEGVEDSDPKALLALSDTVRQRLGDAVVVLGSAGDDRVSLVAQVGPAVVEKGVRAGEVIREAAGVVGGGGGGRDTMAQAGGRRPDKLPDALATARAAVERALSA
jgi:alanyl-tRNA synthetase